MRGRDLHCEGHLPHHHALLDKRGSYAPNGRPAGTGFEDRRGTDTPLITPKLTKDTQHELAVIQALHELAVIQAQFELTVIQTQHDLTIIQAQHELSVIQAKHKLAVIQAQHKVAVIQAQRKLTVIQAHHHALLDERGSNTPHGRPPGIGFENGRGTDAPHHPINMLDARGTDTTGLWQGLAMSHILFHVLETTITFNSISTGCVKQKVKV